MPEHGDSKPTGQDSASECILPWAKLKDYAAFYLEAGLSIIPLKPRSKEPLIPWKEFQERRATREEAYKWFERCPDCNIAIVTGAVSGNLVVIDFDNADKYYEFIQRAREELPEELQYKIATTWHVRTGKGFHIYFRVVTSADRFKEKFRTKPRLAEGVDIKAEGGYVVAPPSVHPSGAQYCFHINDPLEFSIQNLEEDDMEKILALLAPRERAAEPVELSKELSEKQINEIVDIIKPYYVEGHRNNIVYALLGMLIKAGVKYESAKRLVELLTLVTGDEEAKQRLYLVDWHYGRRLRVKDAKELKGVSGLREEIEKILQEKGLDPQEAMAQASHVVAKILQVLGVSGYRGVAWLEIRDGKVVTWATVGKQGIYIMKITSNGSKRIILATSAPVRAVKVGRIYPDIGERLYVVQIGDVEVTGTIHDIISHIKRNYAFDPKYASGIARAIERLADRETEIFYGPGVWYVDGRLVYYDGLGYSPPWKEAVSIDFNARRKERWEIAKGLEILKRFIESYRDPGKASLVICYATIAALAHYIKEKSGYWPHMVVYGKRESGKSTLLDMIELLYAASIKEPAPRTEFQARRLLTKSTLPALIEEANELLSHARYVSDTNRSALGVLHTAATQFELRDVRHPEYGGKFLAIRAAIMTNNYGVELPDHMLDKFLVVELHNEDGIDLSKARGYTPLTMEKHDRECVRGLAYLALEELVADREALESITGLPREKLVEAAIMLAYEAWSKLYRRYGLEPFPKPSVEAVNIEEEAQLEAEMIVDIFRNWVRERLSRLVAEGKVPEFQYPDVQDNPDALELIRSCEPILVRDGGWPYVWIRYCGIAKFKAEHRHIPQIASLSAKMLIKIMGLKDTDRKIGGKIVKHVYILPW